MELMENTVQWKLCALCQQVTREPLKCPADSKNTAGIEEIYMNTSKLLKRFLDAGKLPQNFHQLGQLVFFHRRVQRFQESFSSKKRPRGKSYVKVTLLRQSF